MGFTRSLSLALAEQHIRVNGVAPGPIWTPLFPQLFLLSTSNRLVKMYRWAGPGNR
ncbi:SDR family oxidoreductase [Methylomonas methanica]|uniref:SDR family oxidoreductase n=1 Tax=Methylomonas methanica TaxID=421 RepID=UPI0022B21FB3|nr:SDR family oxidoreductase [Methylomonas methanica]